MARISFEEKLLITEALSVPYNKLKIDLNKAYKEGTQKQINELLNEIAMYNSIFKKLNLSGV